MSCSWAYQSESHSAHGQGDLRSRICEGGVDLTISIGCPRGRTQMPAIMSVKPCQKPSRPPGGKQGWVHLIELRSSLQSVMC